mgnify:CR=1 FL=1
MSNYWFYLGIIVFGFLMFYWSVRRLLPGAQRNHHQKSNLKILSTAFLGVPVGGAVLTVMKILIEWQLFDFPIYFLIFCLAIIWILATLWWFFSGFEKEWARQNPK